MSYDDLMGISFKTALEYINIIKKDKA